LISKLFSAFYHTKEYTGSLQAEVNLRNYYGVLTKSTTRHNLGYMVSLRERRDMMSSMQKLNALGLSKKSLFLS